MTHIPFFCRIWHKGVCTDRFPAFLWQLYNDTKENSTVQDRCLASALQAYIHWSQKKDQFTFDTDWINAYKKEERSAKDIVKDELPVYF